MKVHDQLLTFLLQKNPELTIDKDYLAFQQELDEKLLSWSQEFADINDLIEKKFELAEKVKEP